MKNQRQNPYCEISLAPDDWDEPEEKLTLIKTPICMHFWIPFCVFPPPLWGQLVVCPISCQNLWPIDLYLTTNTMWGWVVWQVRLNRQREILPQLDDLLNYVNTMNCLIFNGVNMSETCKIKTFMFLLIKFLPAPHSWVGIGTQDSCKSEKKTLISPI